MSTPISQFSYNLPKEQIAQHSVEPRDSSRLMILDRTTGEIEHKHFYDILDELHTGDVLVFNDTKVFRARMKGERAERAEKAEMVEMEIFLLRCVPPPLIEGRVGVGCVWQALLRPGKKVQVGDVIMIDDLEIAVREKHEDGVALLEFPLDEAGVLAFTDTHGSIPIPPYVSEVPDDANKYQTVYAREVGSVAAPTAGFHFTRELLEKIKAKGVELAFVTLHVGIGTFRPVQSETIEEHTMHAEFVTISKETSEQINRAKQEGRRVIAVGTTTVRSLEGAAMSSSPSPFEGEGRGEVLPSNGFVGDVNMFIKPGFEFKVIDALITNFHLPKSTLLVLVSALAGREHVLHAYEEAVREQYRFFSFGDAMFVH
ncbi:tRNA preQ1(34) S-adenosylmethionine ribosyltransferase-isomerase QueA [Candidatus Uhrbacteria bacterium RIFOXYB2_FULL_45_11]|uniref:S-adenosylmethionine:tRNA ribosyltransferase-isomerase n=1 Tax=Candidatus Uhrbacteria bacterium RIFOXYB2_FULL_45_11 TaxID=1802421 RepID=A0A1F7W2R6_9BACT|nr:MAG: tRNA preQ1(34) S-adenosylmethionine ribosyltransferase-isomerase QueA [Candidatus Uhrbacteria bacterium RIFOXYB2_FULL_45_11]